LPFVLTVLAAFPITAVNRRAGCTFENRMRCARIVARWRLEPPRCDYLWCYESRADGCLRSRWRCFPNHL